MSLHITKLLLTVITRDVSVTIHHGRLVYHIILMSFEGEQKNA